METATDNARNDTDHGGDHRAMKTVNDTATGQGRGAGREHQILRSIPAGTISTAAGTATGAAIESDGTDAQMMIGRAHPVKSETASAMAIAKRKAAAAGLARFGGRVLYRRRRHRLP